MEKQFMTFTIGEGVFGINILGIREINHSKSFTPVPLSKDHIKGLLNLRGQIVTVWDLAIPLGYSSREVTDNTSLLVMKTNEDLSSVARKAGVQTHENQVGLLVDQIGDVVSCQESEIQPVPAHAESRVAKFLEGVLQQEETLVGLINLQEIMRYE